jgi:hypothetical protein
MRTTSRIVFGALLFALLPAQPHRVEGQAKSMPAKAGFTLETGEACSGISHEECCGQKLEMATFRTQGDYLSGRLKTTVSLACREPNHVVSAQVCRSIAMSRGFAKDVDAICKPALRECQKNGACRQCIADLSKLNYQGSHNVCHALTYVPDRGPKVIHKVIVVRAADGSADDDTRFEVVKRRHKLEQ